MTKKQDLQKELNEKVIPGVKPSDLKKLKRSKSADDIPNTKSSDSNTSFTNPSQALELKKQTDLNTLLTEQLDQKQQEIENLRKQLEEINQKLTEIKELYSQTTAELDNSLEARHQSLKDWNKQQEAIKSLNQELNETIDQASEEIIADADEISSLRTKINQLKRTKEQLEKELKLERIKKGTYPNNPINKNTDNLLSYIPYALLAIWFILLLTNSEKLTVSARLNNKIYD